MQITDLFGAPGQARSGQGTDPYRDLARRVAAGVEPKPEALAVCLERIRSLVLSDRVGFVFRITASQERDQVVLAGEVERPEFKTITTRVLQHLGFSNLLDRVELVPDLQRDPAPFGVVMKPYLMAWSRPDLTGLAMDEAFLGEPVYVFKELPGSILIKNFSGYWGYVAKEALRRITKEEFIRLANAPKALLTADHQANDLLLPSGSRLPIMEWGSGPTCLLLGPSGQKIEVPKTLCQRDERAREMATVLAQARSFLSRPYNMGGKNSVTGIDCSGLVQLAYRAIGLNLARDAKQQYLNGNLLLPCVVEALEPGDALFFMGQTGQVDHTGLYLGDRKILHATGPQVKIQSMDPTAPDYCKRFDHDFIGAKRYWR